MKVIETSLEGVQLIEPAVHSDERGWFMESYHREKLRLAGVTVSFVQDNHSYSAAAGTLRGLHYQLNPKAQTKLVRCTRGAIFDVAVDIRKGSPTFGQWVGVELTAANKRQLLIPKGFAHGFMTLAAHTEVQYKVDEAYAPEVDRTILWNDPFIGVAWPLDVPPITSDKDRAAPVLQDAEINFVYDRQAP